MFHHYARGLTLAALAGAALWPLESKSEDFALTSPRFRAIQVDVSGVRDSGDSVSADWVARELPGELRKSFAAFLAPNDPHAPILLARVDLVELGAQGSGGGINSTQAVDYIKGAAVVVGPGGRTLVSYPFFSAVHAYPSEESAGGVTGHTRVANLALSFAQWLPAKMGL